MGRARRERERRKKWRGATGEEQARLAREHLAREARRSRESGSAAPTFWLHPVKWPASCSATWCRLPRLRVGADMVYCRDRGDGVATILCQSCADRQGIKYRPSREWENREARRRRKRRRTPVERARAEGRTSGPGRKVG